MRGGHLAFTTICGLFLTEPRSLRSGQSRACSDPGAEWFRAGIIKILMSSHTPNLTKRPPRSIRVRLGGYVALPRMLDKCRAEIAGTNGEYHYNCPLDQVFFEFTGVDAEALKKEVATGKGDGEILEWISANAKHKREAFEIAAWSTFQDNRGPDSDADTLGYFADSVGKLSKTREDIKTWADMLDVDDYVSFGGKA